MLKRFIFGGQDSITNPNPNIIRLSKNHESESEYSGFGGKDSNPNPNPNIRYNTAPDAHLRDIACCLRMRSGNTFQQYLNATRYFYFLRIRNMYILSIKIN